MTIGLFFILLAIFLVISLPVGAVFGLMAILPGMMGTLNYGAIDVARAMFSGMNSFTLLAVPLFMVSGMIMAQGGISEQAVQFLRIFHRQQNSRFPVRSYCNLYVLRSNFRLRTGNGICSRCHDHPVPGRDGLRYGIRHLDRNGSRRRWVLSSRRVFPILYMQPQQMHHRLSCLLPVFSRTLIGFCPDGLQLLLLQKAW